MLSVSAEERSGPGNGGANWRVLLTAIFSFALALSLYALYHGAMDFRMFYAAAWMVRQGQGGQLYNLAAQRTFQAQYTAYPGLLFNYPPVSAALYLPLTLTSLKSAYLLWCLGSILALAGVAVMVRTRRGLLADAANFYGVALLFGPALFTLIQGQTSILVLLAYAGALALLRRRRPLAAGIVLSLALIKPQLALPMLAVALLQRRWRIVGGWLLGAAGVLIASVAICGWKVMTEYPRFLRTMGSLPSTGIQPAYMASLRALYMLTRGSEPRLWMLAAVTLLALLVTTRHSMETDRGYALATVVTLLVAYHLFPHDLVLLLIPLAFLAPEAGPSWRLTVVLAGAWLAPLLLVVFYPRALPLLALEMLALLAWILCANARPPQSAV